MTEVSKDKCDACCDVFLYFLKFMIFVLIIAIIVVVIVLIAIACSEGNGGGNDCGHHGGCDCIIICGPAGDCGCGDCCEACFSNEE